MSKHFYPHFFFIHHIRLIKLSQTTHECLLGIFIFIPCRANDTYLANREGEIFVGDNHNGIKKKSEQEIRNANIHTRLFY